MASNSKNSGSSNIQVLVRVRPFNQNESDDQSCIEEIYQKQIILRQKQGSEPPVFSFDKIFGIGTNQNKIYEQVSKNIIDNAFQGINGTVFCYGQTCSGKTYTCVGGDFRNPEEKGVLPRIINQVLQRAEQSPKHIQCKIKISMIEIYNQKIYDLLDTSKVDLKIQANKTRGTFIDKLTEKYILSQEEANNYVIHGVHNRKVGYTTVNNSSSRSHMLITISIHQHDFYSGQARAAKITLVDLAGSQKISKTGVEGKMLEQAKKINTSLSALGKIIHILSEGKKTTYIPYRDSKLTRLLKQSIGGNSITKLIINISPSLKSQQETITSLRFGSRAKKIKNEPRINKQYTPNELLDLIQKYQRKINILTSVIRQIMKQKCLSEMSLKDFIRLYWKQQKNNSDINESDNEVNPISLARSVSKRKSSAMQHIYNKAKVLTHSKSCSSFTKLNIPSQVSIEEKILVTNPQNRKVETQINDENGILQSDNLFRSRDLFRAINHNLLDQEGPSIRNSKIESLQLKRSPSEGRFSQQVIQPGFGEESPTYFNFQNFEMTHHNSEYKSQCFLAQQQTIQPLNEAGGRNNYQSPDNRSIKSLINSMFSINSKVLDLSFSLFQNYPLKPGVSNQSQIQKSCIRSQGFISLNDLETQQISGYEQNSIQFNIQKIRNNLRRMKSLKMNR